MGSKKHNAPPDTSDTYQILKLKSAVSAFFPSYYYAHYMDFSFDAFASIFIGDLLSILLNSFLSATFLYATTQMLYALFFVHHDSWQYDKHFDKCCHFIAVILSLWCQLILSLYKNNCFIGIFWLVSRLQCKETFCWQDYCKTILNLLKICLDFN